MEFLKTFEIYTKVVTVVDVFIDILFRLTDDVASYLTTGVTAAAAIYIALMGYAYISGWIAISQRDMALRFGKVILVLILLQAFSGFTASTFDTIWAIPESVGDFIAGKIFPLYDLGPINILLGSSSSASDFEGLVNASGIGASIIADQVGQANQQTGSYPIIVWALSMAPVALVIISILIAKMITALLFVIAPFILLLSLLGFQNNFLYSWFKTLLSTFLTVIIVYAIGTVGVMMVLAQMALLFIPDLTSIIASFTTNPEVLFSLPRLAPLGITAIFVIMLITQAPQIASAIIGVAAVSTQQATSFMQVAALQTAARAPSIK